MSQVIVPHQPFRDQLADRRRTTLLLFYLAALFIAVSLAGRNLSFRTPLLVLAVVGAVTAILFLLRFLRSNDEHERQINYRARTFAFVEILAFSAAITRRVNPQRRVISEIAPWSRSNRTEYMRDMTSHDIENGLAVPEQREYDLGISQLEWRSWHTTEADLGGIF
jgi:hypothetical protein